MAFFLPSSTSTSTATSLSSSPIPVLRSLESDDESERTEHEPASTQRHRSDDIPTAQSGLTMFGLLSRRISGASDSEISSLSESSSSEGESSWTRRATFGDDNDDRDRDTNMRSPRSTGEDARVPSRRHQQSPRIHEVELPPGPSAGTSRSVHVQQTRRTSPTNQIEEGEAVNRRRRRSHRRHDSTEIDRSARREAKRNRRRRHVFEAFISRDFFLIITLCFGLVCALIVLARPIMMKWFRSRSGDVYMYMDE